MNDFTKTVRLGAQRTYGGRYYSTYAKIKLIDGRLSICGVEGPLPSGNCLGACGQIDMHMEPSDIINPAPGWSHGKIQRFLNVWQEWHLNDMRAGTPAQEAHIKAHKDEYPGFPTSHYTWASELLEKAGLNPDNGYKYGSAWLTVEVPDNVLSWLHALPDTDKRPAWV